MIFCVSMLWCDIVEYSVVCGVVCPGVMCYGIWYGVVYDMVEYNIVLCCIVWYDMI
jgi:hypothetical protein